MADTDFVEGYAFDGPALDLGALVVDGTARKDTRIPSRWP